MTETDRDIERSDNVIGSTVRITRKDGQVVAGVVRAAYSATPLLPTSALILFVNGVEAEHAHWPEDIEAVEVTAAAERHTWRTCPGIGPGSGGTECATCGSWTSLFNTPPAAGPCFGREDPS